MISWILPFSGDRGDHITDLAVAAGAGEEWNQWMEIVSGLAQVGGLRQGSRNGR